MDEDWAPVKPVLAFDLTQTLAWNRVETAIRLLAVGYPLLWQPAVVLSVVEWLKGEPVGRSWHWIPVVDSLNSD